MKILREADLNNIVFIDIETVNIVPELEPETILYDSWAYKMKYLKDDVQSGKTTYEKLFKEQAALHAEFAKVVCITIGRISPNDSLQLKSYYSHDEKELLTNFCKGLNALIAENKRTCLSGHTIKGFDIPFLMRRCIVNGVEPPSLIDVAHLKPWELTALDIGELWKGSGMSGASLLNIAVALGLKNPKERMMPYETTEIYYTDKEQGLERIEAYCKDDVITAANIVRKCRFEPILGESVSTVKSKKVGLVENLYNTKSTDAKLHSKLQERLVVLDESEAKAGKAIAELVTPKTKK